jgi:hypothetical protein
MAKRGFTPEANEILDNWMSKISGSEYKILSFIRRKTVGWRKSSDAISLSQFQLGCGLSRNTVIAGISKLVARGFVIQLKIKTKQGDDAASIYSLNLPMEGSSNIVPPVVENSDYRSSNIELPGGSEKEPTTDSSFTKETSSSSQQESCEDWKKRMKLLGWTEKEINETWRRYKLQPEGTVKNPRMWLESVLHSVRFDLSKENEKDQERAAKEQKEASEASEREKEEQYLQKETTKRIHANRALTELFQGRPWLEYTQGKSYIKLIVNGENYAGCLNFSDSDFQKFLLECMEKEADRADLGAARAFLASLEM